MEPKKRLYRSRDPIVFGVVGGFAEYYEHDPTLYRVVFVVVLLFTGIFPLVIGYIIAGIIMPRPLPANHEPRIYDV